MKWTKEEIETYKEKCLNHFYGMGGNQSIDVLGDKYSFPSYIVCNAEERFALSSNPLSLCYDIVEPEVEYETFKTIKGEVFAKRIGEFNGNFYVCPSDEYIAPIQGISFISTLTGKKFVKPLITFIRKIQRQDGDGTPHGDVNKYLLKKINEAKPYITIRELLEELIEYIGDNEFYFTVEHWQILKHGICDRYLYNCYLANKTTSKKRYQLD